MQFLQRLKLLFEIANSILLLYAYLRKSKLNYQFSFNKVISDL